MEKELVNRISVRAMAYRLIDLLHTEGLVNAETYRNVKHLERQENGQLTSLTFLAD
ncbi:MAG: hypothetical protein IKU29_09915 [Parabacteroides sp.]|nr:hypothetical protein [Parabacteroides sp.]